MQTLKFKRKNKQTDPNIYIYIYNKFLHLKDSTKSLFLNIWCKWLAFFQISASAPSLPRVATWRGTKCERPSWAHRAGWLPRWWSRWAGHSSRRPGRPGSHRRISFPIALSRSVPPPAKSNGSRCNDAPEAQMWFTADLFLHRRCEATISKQIYGVLESQQ